jgi:cell division septum initiation protein DivIVA
VIEEYVSALDENKGLLERLESIEKRLASSSNFINNATI